MGNKVHPLATVALLLWTGLVLLAYEKGIPLPGSLENIVFGELALALVVILACLHCGNFAFRVFQIENPSLLEEALFSSAIGVGLLTTLTFILGLFHCYYDWAAALLLGGFCLLAAANHRYGKTLWFSLCNWRASFSVPECVGVLAMVGFAGIVLVNTLTPPVARDALIHHLAIPKWYLRHHGIVDISFSPPSYYPPFMQMLYTLALLLSSDILAQLFHFFFYVGSLLFTFALARRLLSRATSLLAVLLFASLPVVCQVASLAYADMGLTFYALAGFHALLCWSENRSDQWYCLGALMTAWAVACKYNGFVVLFCFLPGIVLVLSRQQARLSNVCKHIACFLLILVSVNVLWLGKNCWFTGNPLYPLASRFVGTPWLPDQPKFSAYQARNLLHGESLSDQVLLPWNLVVKTRSDARHELDGVVNPILLILIPLFIFLPKKPPGLRGAAFFSLLYFLIFWASANVRLRYLIPIFPMLGIMSAYAVAECKVRGARVLTSFLVVPALLLNLYWILVYTSNLKPFEFLVGKESRQAFLCRHIPCYPVFEYANTHLAPDARVMFLYGGKHGNDGYYLDRDYFYDFIYLGYTAKHLIEDAEDPQEVREALRNLGITHVLINWNLLKIDFSSSLPRNKILLFEKFCQQFLRPEFEKGGSCLYRLS